MAVAGRSALSGSFPDTAARTPNATWVIPSDNEGYKAARVLIDPDPGDNASYYEEGYLIGNPYWRTEVGEFENSVSPYGTFDQGGNAWEWTEAVIGDRRGIRGGSFNDVS